MTVGVVNERRQSIVTVEILAQEGQNIPIAALLDTGFNGDLMLPVSEVERLGLEPISNRFVRLADGRRVETPIYAVEVLWAGRCHAMGVLASGNQPFLGTSPLADYTVKIQMRNGGLVTIEPLPPDATL